MDKRRLQAWWFHRQGLDHPDPSLSSAEILERAGWSRSVGGANPYLTLFSRGRISRERADQDLADQEIHELPCARGCTYIVPRSDFALALKVGQGFSDEASMNTARKFLGVTDAEIEALMSKVEEALAKGPLDPRELKDAVGDASRNLGPEGKKRGQTTTLPLALGFLQSSGRIRRIPVNGRIDQQRYNYAIWQPSPLADFTLTREEAFVELAKRYFRWAGPATPAHFQWFTGLGVGATKNVLSQLNLKELEDGYLIHPEDYDEFETFEVPAEPRYALVSGIDSHMLLRRDLPNLFLPEDAGQQVTGDKGALVSVGNGLQDLDNHAILDRGRIVGVWEYDPFVHELVWHSFISADAALKAEVNLTEAFIREQLEDCRSFSLDSPESRKPRLESLRDLASA